MVHHLSRIFFLNVYAKPKEKLFSLKLAVFKIIALIIFATAAQLPL